MWTNHLSSHKYNWCHVIDTIIQLYIIAGLRIKLKSIIPCPWGPRGGHHFVCLKILVLQGGCFSQGQIWALSLMYVVTDAYGSLCFSAIFSASLLLSLLHSGAIPPLVKTRGLNEDFSMSITLWLYFLLFFMLLVDLCQGLPRIGLWGRMCDPYVKESFLTAIPQSSRRYINLALSAVLTFL